MATVFLGNDLKHDRQVAIKVLHPEIGSALGPERFLLEIRIAARLTHPHIVPLHDSGEADGLLFYVMPFVEGESLRDRLTREKQLPVDEAIRIAREVADALQYAHAHKVLHRDIKPENILLQAGHAVVADFGVARAIGEAGEQRVTATGIAVGTPSYMSPEQAAGTRDLDGRSDLYSLACVLYEMLAGQPPFTGPTVESVVRQHLTADAPTVAHIRQSVPPEVSLTLTRALAKAPADRFSDTRQFADALERRASSAPPPDLTTARPPTRLPVSAAARRPRKRALVMLSVGLLTLLVVAVAFTKTARVLWARTQALPTLQGHVATGNWEAAHRLAARVEAVLPNDSSLAVMRSTFSDGIRVEGTPVGARVYRKAYNNSDDWEFLGLAPIGRVVVPRLPVVSQFKVEAPGFRTAFDIGAAAATAGATPVVRFSLAPEGTTPDDMVLVPGGELATGIPQLDPGDRARIADFYLDRFEVTNREYQTFVDSGGYKRRDLWEHDFIEDGRRLTWEEATRRFVDQTGRQGPSTWEAGRYPPERANHPVTGVSWFEAAAYAKFRGKRLPNVFQWSRAARFEAAGAILSASNIERMRGGGTAPVGSFGGMSGSGALDMAGNAREWCLNESKSVGGRFILGGAWNDAAYRFFESAIHSPFDRSATNGIRLVSGGDRSTAADRPIEPIFRDYRAERPVSDETFQFYRRLFAYDRLPLNGRMERRDTTAHWIREKVSYDAPYGRERITAFVFLPLHERPPYQTVVFFPPSPALRARSSDSLFSVGMFDFLVQGGRAVIYPVYKGTYERDDGTRFSDPDTTNRYREHAIQWQQDVSRTVDYLRSRADIDSARLGFLGHSWGGRLGSVVLAIEPRFAAAVLSAGGLNFRRAQPEVDDFNYVPRVRIPVLMLNGRHDNTFPLETAVKPMFDLLGAPADRKRLVVADGVHYVPRNVLIGETLDWFDRYLGPVK